MGTDKVTVNRAPVLTLWAAVVAERLGYEHDAALTLGRAVAGLNAQSKGRSLGIYHAREGADGDETEQPPEPDRVELLGRGVEVLHTEDGLRAASKGKAADPASVTRYLTGKFKDDLPAVQEAMKALAESMPPDRLAEKAYALYERFRPEIPRGKAGWGAAGELDLDLIRRMAGQNPG